MKRSFATLAVLGLIALGFYVAVYLKAVFGGGGDPHLFFHPENVANILGQAAVVGILACGMTLVIVSGHIDLSAGSLMGMLGAVAAWLMASRGAGWNGPAAALAALALGAGLGALQGSVVAWLRVPSFVVTLGGLLAFRGVLLLVAASTIPVESAFVNGLGAASVAGLPARFLVMIALAAAVHVLATRFRFGRYLYAIGGNARAARYAGIRVEWHLAGVFALMGAVAGLAGVVLAGIQMAADAGAGDLMELYAIAACVIGGTSLSGGRGTVSGSVIGALIMAVIRNGLSCLGVASAGEKIILGLILVCAVGLDLAFSRNRE
jgi:ribose/xylose/arabinose/galactoside ABC-type transport system permease subunit